MYSFNKLFVFTLMNQKYAIDLLCVDKSIHAVEITPLPENIITLLGIINYHGIIIPVLNIRKKLNLPHREIDIDDCIVIVKVSGRTVAFIADSLDGVMEFTDENMVKSDEILPHLQNIEGVVKLSGDMILIHDLEKTLSIEVKKDIDTLAELRNG